MLKFIASSSRAGCKENCWKVIKNRLPSRVVFSSSTNKPSIGCQSKQLIFLLECQKKLLVHSGLMQCYCRKWLIGKRVAGKVLTVILCDGVITHLYQTNSLLGKSQHDRYSTRFCLTNLLEYFHDVTILPDEAYPFSKGNEIKTLDKVPHKHSSSVWKFASNRVVKYVR